MATLLLVEDDRHQRLLVAEELEADGHTVLRAADAREALVWMAKTRPDLVILDVRLPGMDGIALLGKLLDHDRLLPVVLHSAYASYRDNYLAWAADAYLLKQSDLRPLKSTVRRLLATRAALSGASSPDPPSREAAHPA
ncbi:MAG: response regulator [Planctomycetota bacterium]